MDKTLNRRHISARQVITCRLHPNFRHQVMCRCICLPGETVVQRREVPDVVQDCIHHAIAKEEGDRL